MGVGSPRSWEQRTDSQEGWAEEPRPAVVVPSTPFLHKYKTELCKNWELEGTCVYGDTVNFY
jgi:hypothetical protein